MKYFYFQCLLLPTIKHPNRGEVAAGIAVAWVQAETLEKARVRLFDRFVDAAWLLQNLEVEREQPLALHPWYRIDTLSSDAYSREAVERSWRELQDYGIGVEILGMPGKS